MDAQHVLDILRKYMNTHQLDMGILNMGVFGSIARDEAAGNSDVDVVISLENPNLFTLSRIRQDLEQELHRHVDIVSLREKMNPYLKAAIQQEARYV